MNDRSADQRQAFLIWRRDGRLWGVSHLAVVKMTRHSPDAESESWAAAAGEDSSCRPEIEQRYELIVGEAVLPADEILGVTELLQVRPAGTVLRRYWPEAVCGVAVHEGAPVVLIDPAAPPRVLRPRPASSAASPAPVHLPLSPGEPAA